MKHETIHLLQVLTRVKGRLQAGLRDHRFVQMSRTAGERHRQWGVTAAFVLQMSTLRRFCGLTETTPVSCGDSDESWKADDVKSLLQGGQGDCDDEGKEASRSGLERLDDGSSVVKVADKVSADHNVDGEYSFVVELYSVSAPEYEKANFFPETEFSKELQTALVIEADCHEKVLKFLSNSLNDLKLSRAHDSAIDSTGFFEATDSDSSDACESSSTRLKRSTSQDSVGSDPSESWDTVTTKNLRVPRSVSLDSIESKASSAKDSAFATSEDDESDSSTDTEQEEETRESAVVSGGSSQLYAVDERHAELLGVIRWTTFEDLLKVLRIHAEEESYVSAAGPGLCVLDQPEKQKKPDIVEQALMTALSTSAEDEPDNTDQYNIIEQAYLIAMSSSSEGDIETDNITSVVTELAPRNPSEAFNMHEEDAELGRSQGRFRLIDSESSDSEYEPQSSDSDTESESSCSASEASELDVSFVTVSSRNPSCGYADNNTTLVSPNGLNSPERKATEDTSRAATGEESEEYSVSGQNEQQTRDRSRSSNPLSCWLESEPRIPFSAGCSKLFNFNSDCLDDSQTEFWTTGRTGVQECSSSEIQDASVSLPGEGRSSSEDSDNTNLTICPRSNSSERIFSDTFPNAVPQTLFDECTEASRWLENHPADTSAYSPCKVHGGRSSPSRYNVDNCCGCVSPRKSSRPFSVFSDESMRKYKGHTSGSDSEEDSENAEDLSVSSTPFLKVSSGYPLDDVVSSVPIDLDESELSFAFTGRI